MGNNIGALEPDLGKTVRIRTCFQRAQRTQAPRRLYTEYPIVIFDDRRDKTSQGQDTTRQDKTRQHARQGKAIQCKTTKIGQNENDAREAKAREEH